MRKGKIYYVTGGTTKAPMLIGYDYSRWERSVKITHEVLYSHGVNENSVIAVCHPFAPWAIGGVFAEAALLCGASVYPLGLYAEKESFLELLSTIKPTHLCGTAKNFIRWKSKMNGLRNNDSNYKCTLFVAGDILTDTSRNNCRSSWNAKVIDIYGMAEFDTIAFELPNSEKLTLVPYFDYAILFNDSIHQLEAGQEGELLIKEKYKKDWTKTGDNVRIIKRVKYLASQAESTWEIGFLNRINESAILSDGTAINLAQLKAMKSAERLIDKLQIQLHNETDGDLIKILYTAPINNNIDEKGLIEIFLNSSVDIMDSYTHGIIKKISIQNASIDNFIHTLRDKAPSIITLNENEAIQRHN